MKKIRLIVAIAALLTAFEQKTSAQFNFYGNDQDGNSVLFEIGGSLGVMNCLTDLGGTRGLGRTFVKDLNIGNNQLNGSIYLSALYKYAVGIRLEATLGKVKAYDSILKPVRATAEGRYERNLQFRSKINEIALVAEFHLIPIKRLLFGSGLDEDDGPPRFSPYLLGGIGFFSFNPQSQIGNQWINLQPLSLEGQGFSEYPERKPYKLNQMNKLLGMGIKFDLSPSLNLRTEFLYRILTTDYLDDVSTRYINANLFQNYYSGVQLQNALDLSRNDRVNPGGPTGIYRKTEGGIRGDPTDKDAYFSLNVKLGLKLGKKERSGRRSGLDQLKCPTRF